MCSPALPPNGPQHADKKLHRLVSYIHSSLALRLVAWVGDHPKDMSVKLNSNADFAGDCKRRALPRGCSCSCQGLTLFTPWLDNKRSNHAFRTVHLKLSWLPLIWQSGQKAFRPCSFRTRYWAARPILSSRKTIKQRSGSLNPARVTTSGTWRARVGWTWHGSKSKLLLVQ